MRRMSPLSSKNANRGTVAAALRSRRAKGQEAISGLSNEDLYAIAVLALSLAGGLSGHYGGDYPLQGNKMACRKQQHTTLDHVRYDADDARTREEQVRDAYVALATHCVTYALTQAVTKALLYRVAGLRVPFLAQLGGAFVSALLHGAVDDGRLLLRFSQVTNKLSFYNTTDHGVNGRQLLDQAFHKWLGVVITAMATTALASMISKRRDRAAR